jgi:hypothetical protein
MERIVAGVISFPAWAKKKFLQQRMKRTSASLITSDGEPDSVGQAIAHWNWPGEQVPSGTEILG